MAKWLNAEVLEKINWNDRLYSLRIELADDADGFGFDAGQFVRVALDVEGERIARPYSLVNVPGTGHLEIFFNIVPEGPLSPRLAALEAGDMVYIAERPSGFLTVTEVPEARHLWMLATGTGVGPFLSILGSEKAWSRFEKVVLVYSVRDVSELSYRDQIAAVQQANPDNFVFIPVVTREKVEGALDRRIPLCIDDGSFEQLAGVELRPEHSHVMMCGNSEMISDASESLKRRGMRKHLRREPGHITTEKYH